MKLLDILFKRKKLAAAVDAVRPQDLGAEDVIDIVARGKNKSWKSSKEEYKVEFKFRSIEDFPMAEVNIGAPDGLTYVGDSKAKVERVIAGHALDSTYGGFDKIAGTMQSAYAVPEGIGMFFTQQGFIGYQFCAILAQHWLIDKACSMSVEDAVRNGWEIKSDAADSLTEEQRSTIGDWDIKMKVKDNLIEMGRFTNVFGVRLMIFEVESTDKDYYSKPFNIDGVTKGSYKGISQVDPYWTTPLMTSAAMQNPAAIHFYDPEFWIINGKRYHRSHLIICRGPQPADILKPTYIFGGIPLTQRIYERVYAAERVANESPLLAMNKRTTAIHVDTAKGSFNEEALLEKILRWVRYRDNHSVKILGKEETIDQYDTSLADLDNVIMNQYQLVAAIAKTPATKIMGTPPKGFNSTGEFETVSYHEELESLQEKWFTAPLDRHYLLLLKSLDWDVGVSVVWEPVDAMTAAQLAEINGKKVTDIGTLIDKGVVSPDEGRHKLKTDRNSGWNNLDQIDSAETEQGASPQNIALLEEAGAQIQKGQAQLVKAGDPSANQEVAGHQVASEENAPDHAVTPQGVVSQQRATTAPATDAEPAAAATGAQGNDQIMQTVLAKLQQLETMLTPDTTAVPDNMVRGVQGLIQGVPRMDASVAGVGQVIPALPESMLPKVKVAGLMVCVENPKGSVRTGASLNGAWSQRMKFHYGYIRGTTGADGDEIDVFLGDNLQSPRIFVINQLDINSGEFDEHKAMIGFNTPEEAQQAYNDSFEDGWVGFDSMVEMNVQQFRQWAMSQVATSPLDDNVIQAQTQNAPQEPNL